MKYLKKFQTNTDYQAFKSGNDWATPNVSVTEENTTIYYNPIVSSLLFPVTLVEGETSENGRLLYEYICNNYEPGASITPNEVIFITENGSTGANTNNTTQVYSIQTINNYNYTYGFTKDYSGISLQNEGRGGSGFTLTPDGYLVFWTVERE